MATKHGIGETKELVEGIMEVSLRLVEIFKDGVDMSDVALIWDLVRNDEQFKQKMAKAWDGYKKIPLEVKDMDPYEAVELTTCLLVFIPKILEVLKSNKSLHCQKISSRSRSRRV